MGNNPSWLESFYNENILQYFRNKGQNIYAEQDGRENI